MLNDYLLIFRLNKAKEILERERNISCKESALPVGYSRYVQFTKVFKKNLSATFSTITGRNLLYLSLKTNLSTRIFLRNLNPKN